MVVLNMVTSVGFPTAVPMPPAILQGEGHGAMVGVDPAVLEGVVEAHAGGGVERLVEDGGGDAGEEGSGAFGLDNAHADDDGDGE